MSDQVLLPDDVREKLLEAGRLRGDDPWPVVKLFTPDAGCTWLLCELSEDRDMLFGLCDVGHGQPELGYVSLAELEELRGNLGLPIERDLYWTPRFPISRYAAAARDAGRIVDEIPEEAGKEDRHG